MVSYTQLQEKRAAYNVYWSLPTFSFSSMHLRYITSKFRLQFFMYVYLFLRNQI